MSTPTGFDPIIEVETLCCYNTVIVSERYVTQDGRYVHPHCEDMTHSYIECPECGTFTPMARPNKARLINSKLPTHPTDSGESTDDTDTGALNGFR